jgi:hypothetical protein
MENFQSCCCKTLDLVFLSLKASIENFQSCCCKTLDLVFLSLKTTMENFPVGGNWIKGSRQAARRYAAQGCDRLDVFKIVDGLFPG